MAHLLILIPWFWRSFRTTLFQGKLLTQFTEKYSHNYKYLKSCHKCIFGL